MALHHFLHITHKGRFKSLIEFSPQMGLAYSSQNGRVMGLVETAHWLTWHPLQPCSTMLSSTILLSTSKKLPFLGFLALGLPMRPNQEGGGKQLRWQLHAKRSYLRAKALACWGSCGRGPVIPARHQKPWQGRWQQWDPYWTTLAEVGISPNNTEPTLESLPPPQIYKVNTLY